MVVTPEEPEFGCTRGGRLRKVCKTGSKRGPNWAQEMLFRACALNDDSLLPTPEAGEDFMAFPRGHTDVPPPGLADAKYAEKYERVYGPRYRRKRLKALGNSAMPLIPMMIGDFVRQVEAQGVFSAKDSIKQLKEDGMIERPPEQDPPGIQTGEKISRVESRYASLDVEGTKKAYQELNLTLEGMANAVVKTIDEIVPHLAKMQALLSQRGAGRKKVLKKAGLPRWTHWAKSYEKKFDCTLRTIQLRIKLHREGRRQGASGGVKAGRSPANRRSASKAPARIDSRQQEWLLKSHAAANKLVAALKSGGDWKGPLGEYERATRPPAKLKARPSAQRPEPDWKGALASLVDTLEQCGDKLPIPAIKGMQHAQALLEGSPAADSQRGTGPRLTVCPPAGSQEEEVPVTFVQPKLRKTA
jgi:hypothetical protein